jgi:hypothetical protein
VLASSVNFEVELKPFTFVNGLQARPLYRADMHESVRLAIVTHEETEALHCVEEFDRASSFVASQLALRSAACRTFGAFRAIAAAAIRHWNDIADNLEILRGNLAAAIDQVEFKGLPFRKASQASTLNRTDVHERIFAAIILLDETEALLRIEELYRALAGTDDLGGHAAETAAACTAACAATRSAATGAATAAAAAEAITAAAAKPVATATAAAETITAAAIAIATKTTLRFAAEWGKALFTKTIALVAAPASAPFVVTHNKIRTFVTPPGNHHVDTRAESAPDICSRSRSLSEFPLNRLQS